MTEQQTTPSASGLSMGLVMALFVIVGSPMAYYLWHVLTDLLSGHFHGPSVLMGTGVLLLLLGLLRVLSYYLKRV
jgi:hypothetical protein